MTPEARAQRLAAYRATRRALRSGELTRSPMCEDCGRTTEVPIHAHHHKGYEPEHQLDVVWLCWDCHAWRHSTGRRRGSALPPDVQAAFAVVQEWARKEIA